MRPWTRRLTPELAARFRSAGAWLDRTVNEYLEEAAERLPERRAVSDAVWHLTFAELLEVSRAVAGGLAERGIGNSSVIGVQTANQAEFMVAHYALASLGAVTLSLPASLGSAETAQLLASADADGVVLEAARAEGLVERLQRRLPVWTYRHGQGEEGPLDGLRGVAVRGAPKDADRDYVMMPTAGTTGLPKLAVRTHNAWLAMARKKLSTFESLRLSGDDCSLVLSPVNQGMGYFHGFVIPHLVPGWRRVLLERFDPDEALALIERERVSVLVGVPAHAIRMLRHPSLDGYDLSSLKVVQSGGDAFSPDLRAEFEDRLGVPVILDYGASDVGAACAPRPDDPALKRRETVGRPMPWTEVSIRDLGGVELEPGKDGEIWIQGPDLISGYYPADEAAYDPERGFPTGDLGHFDDDGFLVVSGRLKEIIIRGGLNISPAEVEMAVRLHPAIAEAAAIGMPDPVLGERICVFVVTHAAAEVSLNDVLERLAAYGVPKAIWPERLILVHELPLSPGGKVQKTVLREWLAATAIADRP